MLRTLNQVKRALMGTVLTYYNETGRWPHVGSVLILLYNRLEVSERTAADIVAELMLAGLMDREADECRLTVTAEGEFWLGTQDRAMETA